MTRHRLRRFQLTYPIKMKMVVEASTLKDAIKICYKEYLKSTDIPDGMFTITDLDKNESYDFRKKVKKSARPLTQYGGIKEVEIFEPELATKLETKDDPMVKLVDEMVDAKLETKDDPMVKLVDEMVDAKLQPLYQQLKSTETILQKRFSDLNTKFDKLLKSKSKPFEDDGELYGLINPEVKPRLVQEQARKRLELSKVLDSSSLSHNKGKGCIIM